MLKDIKAEPERILKLYASFINHTLSLIDQKGYDGFNFLMMSNTHQSFVELFKFALQG